VLATTRITIPVSNEVECRGCHASGANPDAQPSAGYANDPDPNRDFKLNILQVHDERNRRNPAYVSALASVNYSPSGLKAMALAGTPVSCVICHASNQSGDPGLPGLETLTQAMHANHANNIDPKTGDILDNGTTRATCYNCHPGNQTQALRGAMSKSMAADGTVQIECQSCHGNLSALANPSRQGWVDLPNCQACHIGTAATAAGNLRLTIALDPNGNLNTTSDNTFATTPSTLFRASLGHGNLQCGACHGSTHAELASFQSNDTLQAADLTGQTGPIRECTACHQSGISSASGGPHGMHDVGSSWANSHDRAVGRNASACAPCHGQDFRGTVLSRAFTTRTISTDFGTIQMFRGYQVSCYTCHAGPNGGRGQQPALPNVGNATAVATIGQNVTIPITVTSNGILRIVSQPQHGSAYVAGSTIVYQPAFNFEGTEQITYAALNNGRDSNLGTATVTVKAATRPQFAASGVTNAASYVPGVAPGMIAYMSGSGMGPAALTSYEFNSGGFIEKLTARTRVLFDNIPAPLLYTSDGAVSAIVPYGISTSGATSMVVEYNGIQSTPVAIPVSLALPGIFTADSSGKGDAACLNQDGSFNSPSNAAARGSVITLFVTGEGATSPAGIAGKLAIAPYATPVQPVTVLIGGQPAAVQYAGAAPGEPAGMMQINAVIPTTIDTGRAAVAVSIGGFSTAAGVTVELK